MKKRILFVVPSFAIGGTIVSLSSLLSVINTAEFDVDVFALAKKGQYLDKLENCRILPENQWLSTRIYDGGLIKKTISFIIRALIKLTRKFNCEWFVKHIYEYGGRKMRTMQYDDVICFVESIANRVCYYPAKRRITWIHCDYMRYLSLIGNKDEIDFYERFNTIVCVSKNVMDTFCESLPYYATKTVLINNIINVSSIRKRSIESGFIDPRFSNDDFTIISVGRFDPVKQFEKIPEIVSNIKRNTDTQFHWYIIGGQRGTDDVKNSIMSEIMRYGVLEQVILLGEKTNPYPYIAKSDLYVTTSMSESFSLVIHEAKSLGIPVLANNFSSACESLSDGIDGFIVPLDKMPEKIITLINDRNLLLEIKSNIDSRYDVEMDLDKIKSIL